MLDYVGSILSLSVEEVIYFLLDLRIYRRTVNKCPISFLTSTYNTSEHKSINKTDPSFHTFHSTEPYLFPPGYITLWLPIYFFSTQPFFRTLSLLFYPLRSTEPFFLIPLLQNPFPPYLPSFRTLSPLIYPLRTLSLLVLTLWNPFSPYLPSTEHFLSLIPLYVTLYLS